MFGIEIDVVKLKSLFDVDLAIRSIPFVLEGVPMALYITVIGMIAGLILGLILSLSRSSKQIWFRWPARMYISFMRGTPMLVFLYILYFGLPVIGIKLTAVAAATIAFGLNSAAYIAEINRAAFNGIDQGQWESAKALNLSYSLTVRKVILPQATRIAIPSLANVFMDMLKATSLAAVITVPELFQKAQIVAGRTFDSMTMYILVALIYWPLCVLISALQDYLEKRFSKFL